MPYFSVVMATYNRGVHILPSIHSVLAQTFQDFELLVVGDCCTDDTEAVLRPFLGDKVRWINLAQRGGSQSFPNNAGIEHSSGEHIAYLGHDDLWARDHLERLADVFGRRNDFAVSGCVCHPPAGARDWLVLGLFDDDQAKFEHFFPPSSFAHSRRATQSIGGWRDGRAIRAPVDADLLLRAARAGLSFASTHRVTVHKFVAASRYLSYVQQSSDEQAEMLRRMQQPGFEEAVAAIVEASKRAGTYMSLRHPAYENYGEGEISRGHSFGKGASRAPLQPLSGSALIRQANEPRGIDWKLFEAGEARFRWSHLNPRPKILIPFTSRFPVYLRLQVAHQDPEVLKALRIEVNGAPVRVKAERLHHNGTMWEATAAMTATLSESDYSIAVLVLPDAALPGGNTPGIAVAEMRLDQQPTGAKPPREFDEGEAELSVALQRERELVREIYTEHAAERDALAAARRAAAELTQMRDAREMESRAETAELRQRLADVKRSLSWRLTAPLRELRRIGTKVAKELRRTRRKLLRHKA
jgi:glycosyltransferase involved in cell wall biosynthesis